jgi:hypothetical protein
VRFGALLKNPFARPQPDRQAAQQVKDWARAALQASDDTAFTVNEIICADPGCPGIETVILVMKPGEKTRAYKISKSLNEVTEQDIGQALES